ncbi:MAG: NAD-dependent epimerase/dehydratase family protein [Halioglobus sp.]
MRALVLGGNGFIGSHLTDALLAAGHKVRVFDRGPELYRAPLRNVDYRFADFGDFSALAEALQDIDIIYHLISTTVPSTSNLDPVGDIQGNLVNTVKLLQLMVSKNIVRIVYLSSGGTVYGVPDVSPIPETHALNPICSYGVTKVAIENYLYMYQSLHQIKPAILRPSNPYGERQGHAGVQGIVGTFLNKTKSGERIEIWGDGSVIRDFICVTDLAELGVKVGQSDFCGVLNVGSGSGCSIHDLVDALAVVTGNEIEPQFLPGRAYDVPEIVLDISKANREMAWQPRIQLQAGLRRTWQWLNTV